MSLLPKFHVTAQRDGATWYVSSAAAHWYNGYPDCPQHAPSLTRRFVNMVKGDPIQYRKLSFGVSEINPAAPLQDPPVALGLRDAVTVARFMLFPFKGSKLRISSKAPVAKGLV